MITSGLPSMCLLLLCRMTVYDSVYSIVISTQEIAGIRSESGDLLGAQNPQPQSDLLVS